MPGAETFVDSRQPLPAGLVLDGCYQIQRVVGGGGFALTYEATDTNLGTTVAIKEYYPVDLGLRADGLSIRPRTMQTADHFQQGRESFMREARTLARFNHPNIVRVLRVFEANDSAYITMRFESGPSFEAWLQALGRVPTQEELDGITANLLSALEEMHKAGLLHRDIAPDNIIIRADGTPVLLDFGAAKRATAEKTRTIAGIVKLGYSPQEQYAADSSHQGPWTDLYALGASLYRAIAGHPPPEAPLRFGNDTLKPTAQVAADEYRANFMHALDWCLQLRPADRPQSVAVLRDKMGLPSITRPITSETKLVSKAKTVDRSGALATAGKWMLIISAGVLLSSGTYLGIDSYLKHAEAQKEARAGAERERADIERLKREEQMRQQRAALAAEEMEKLRKRQEEQAAVEAMERRKREDEERRIAAEKKAAEDKRIGDERIRKAAEDKRIADEKKAAEDKRIAAEKKAAEDKRIADERKAAEDKRIADEKKAAEDKRIADEKKAAEDKRTAAEKKAAEDKRIADEKKAAEEKRIADEKKAAEDKRIAAEKKAAEDKRIAAEKKAAEDKRIADEKKAAEEKRIAARREAKPTQYELNTFATNVSTTLQKVRCFTGLNATRITDVQAGLDRFAERMQTLGRTGPPRLQIASANVGEIEKWLELASAIKEDICPVAEGQSIGVAPPPAGAAPANPPARATPPAARPYTPPAPRPAPAPAAPRGGAIIGL